jgi:Dockerin type I domain
MRFKRNLAQAILSVLVAIASVQFAVAQPPDVLRRYRVIPRFSSLEQSGGIAGVHFEYDLRGRFGLVTGYIQDPVIDSPLPVLVPYAQFVGVDINALLDRPTAFGALVPLENFVDLEKLWSIRETLPVLHFHGKDAQGAPFELRAVTRGPLIRLRGETQPICCDFFQYQLEVLAYQTPYGDFNFDGRVDASDYTVWRDTMGSTTDLAADGNGDGVVDHEDYLVWRGDMGTVTDLSVFDEADGLDGLGATGVPEPSTFLLLIIAAVGAGFAAIPLRPHRRSPFGG